MDNTVTLQEDNVIQKMPEIIDSYKNSQEKFLNQKLPKIKVFGVGGAGSNAVNRMLNKDSYGIEYYVFNTDAQDLKNSLCENKIILGPNTTKGLGAGGNPEVGKDAAIESSEEIEKALEGADMVFITCGMGGGTGTGATPIIAELAKEKGILTIGVVTTPFDFEGLKRTRQAREGIAELEKYADSTVVISDTKLLETVGDLTVTAAFNEADYILKQGIHTISNLLLVPSLINLDYSDVLSVLKDSGRALIGIGIASGQNRAIEAAKRAINSPILETSIDGAKSAIVNITSGSNTLLRESGDSVKYIKEAAGNNIDIIYGLSICKELKDIYIVTVIATRIEKEKKEPIVQKVINECENLFTNSKQNLLQV